MLVSPLQGQRMKFVKAPAKVVLVGAPKNYELLSLANCCLLVALPGYPPALLVATHPKICSKPVRAMRFRKCCVPHCVREGSSNAAFSIDNPVRE